MHYREQTNPQAPMNTYRRGTGYVDEALLSDLVLRTQCRPG